MVIEVEVMIILGIMTKEAGEVSGLLATLKLIWEGGLNGCVRLVKIHWVVHLWFVYFSLPIFPWKAYAKFLSKRPCMTMPLPLPRAYFFKKIFWGGLHPAACRILVHWPGTEPIPPAVEIWSLNHWTSRDSDNATPSPQPSFLTAPQLCSPHSYIVLQQTLLVAPRLRVLHFKSLCFHTACSLT